MDQIVERDTKKLTITQELPKMVEGVGLVDVPYKPHVFKVDVLRLPVEGEEVDLKNQIVLLMHGEMRHGTWFAKYFTKGGVSEYGSVTVKTVVDSYEQQTGKKIDALAVCSSLGSDFEELDKEKTKRKQELGEPMKDMEGKIHVIFGKTRVPMVKDSEGKVVMDLRAETGKLYIPKGVSVYQNP